MKQNPKYPGCWYCDNIIDYRHQIGLLHLGFPRCFVLMKSDADFYYCRDFEEWKTMIAEINWLDPSDRGMRSEQEGVLETLWNFAIEQEAMEEALLEGELEDDM